MRAAEVLNRYAEGERNFQGANLCGQSFCDKDLSGADFTNADLRGVNFSNSTLKESDFSGANLKGVNFTHANLRGANLSRVQCGIRKRWLVIFWLVALLSSAFVGFSAHAFTPVVTGESSFRKEVIHLWSCFVLIFSITLLLLLPLSKRRYWVNPLFSAGILALWLGFLAFLGLGTLIVPLLGSFLVGTLLCPLRIELSTKMYRGIAFSTISLVIVAAVLVHYYEIAQGAQNWLTYTFPTLFFGFLINGIRIGNFANYVDFLKEKSFLFSMHPGIVTTFGDADLSEANLTGAKLKHSDLRGKISKTCFFGAKDLSCSKSNSPLLNDMQLCRLVVSGDGHNQNFDQKNLGGAYLEGANLDSASFKGSDLSKVNLVNSDLKNTIFYQANLSDADLRQANLTGAQLVQAQLANANLTGATLTAACIEDWNITTHTLLEGVFCRFVFMRQVKDRTYENPHRKPDDWEQEFEEGDFADFIKPLTDTLDLYHNRNIDPRAIAIAFKHLSDDNPDAGLRIVAMESRGDDQFMLRAKTEEQANKSELHHQYFQTYDQVRDLPADEQFKLLLAEKDSRIRSLEEMLKQAITRPNFLTIEQKQGDFMSGGQGNLINAKGNVSGVNQGDRDVSVQGDMVGSVIGDQNTADIKIQRANLPQPQSVDIHQELLELQQILTQLVSADQRKIQNALSDAEDELNKPQPDKDEVGQALGRALDYAKKAEGFAESMDKLQPHMVEVAGWLGQNWHKLLTIVGLSV
ncbi:pentapeptide repeat-containing protein [Lyngbya confervoides]|uniref:Pentapeptide repeat-containing protein n=1 Tax=Lyngbya confervoides BDU141951 TaxID=1574623 RepID=A0ABD4T0P9_9CYAN|nr:pentapeptide repeat-containing protein [Lyngbya confervoides]MCM1982099.1 pentapeptide repeat-containing protein [Lyngbya confervoides BDU141951]